VLAKKGIALSLCMTDLLDYNLAVVGLHALCSPFYRRTADLVITVLAGLAEVFSATS
jgi:hypothetical protein